MLGRAHGSFFCRLVPFASAGLAPRGRNRKHWACGASSTPGGLHPSQPSMGMAGKAAGAAGTSQSVRHRVELEVRAAAPVVQARHRQQRRAIHGLGPCAMGKRGGAEAGTL